MIHLVEYEFQTKKKMFLSVFNVITIINESKILTQHMQCKRKNKVHGRKSNSNQNWTTINVNVSAKIPEKIMSLKRIIFGILLRVLVKMVNILKVLLVIQKLSLMKL